MNLVRSTYLDAIGVSAWRLRSAVAPVADEGEVNIIEPEVASHQERNVVEDVATLDWDQLQSVVTNCTACGLHANRQQVVFGAGDRAANLLIIGEAPGAEEDKQGEPFVGRAGQLLNAMIGAIGLQRKQVFIANILKCRPPNNRDPNPSESTACAPFLARQIELLQPQAVLALGRIAAQQLLRSELPVGKLRGQISQLEPWGIPLVVSYHPAYLLRSPSAKAKSWQDLLKIRELLTKEK